MDAADDGWTLEDPVRDAAAKSQALLGAASTLRAGLEQAEQETQLLAAQVKEREGSTVGEIRRQIGELEALLAREIARAAQEGAQLQAALQNKRDGAQRSIEQLNQTAQEFQRLIAQFSSTQAR